MLGAQILKNQNMQSVLASQSTLKQKGSRVRKSLVFVITLTSLIDAFSILVIYLLVNFSNTSQNLQLDQTIQLPAAVHNDPLSDGTVVSVRQGKFFLENKEMRMDQLLAALIQIVQTKNKANLPAHLIIQADKQSEFSSLSPLVLAGAQAGFHQLKFAVLDGAK